MLARPPMSQKPRITKPPEVRREELLTAALKLFQEVGYENTSVQMVTDYVGISKGLFYHYFESKAVLLNELVGWQAELFVAGLPRSAAEMPGGSLDKLRAIVSRATQWKLSDMRDISRTYLEVMYCDENRGLRTALLSKYTRALVPLFAEIIAEAKKEGLCQVDDPTLAAELGLALGVGLQEPFGELILGLPDPEKLARLVVLTRAVEQGMERILGMQPGTLRLYDAEQVAGQIALLV
jgi:AcrR family transcriptional regulator